MPLRLATPLGWLLWIWVLAIPLHAADLAGTRAMLLSGDYAKVIDAAHSAASSDSGDEEWPLLLGRALLTVGRYSNALAALRPSLEQFPFSLRLRLLAREAALFNGDAALAGQMVEEIGQLANRRPWAYRDPPNLVALGQTALLLGADPRKVLENTFDRARKADPDYREAQLGSAGVALSKNDTELAARLLNESLKKFPKDPDFHHALARAYAPGDRKAMLESIAEALSLNENHVPSYILLAEHLIDAEAYDEAELKLARALEVNPHEPEAWALRAVLAHLGQQLAMEQRHRARALEFYTNNPAVDSLIGLKLSQKYRFAEGAAYQRRALELDPTHVPAKSRLAQDLLRLGQEDEGWSLLEQVYTEDGYDVVVFNLASLKDNLGSFTTLTNSHFVVRMGTNEAPVYGDRVMALLGRAHTNLCQKYGIELQSPTIVEMYPDQKDFAVRTFGMPGGAGYLGVCFGRLITANSPATQAGRAASWESVLWHEFCHVVTLQMTRNKMPRWLSEGISVYEELAENPSWGQSMNPQYREMILGEGLHKIHDLSSAFLAPPSGQHLMFAYYQSYLVVRFISEKYGVESLRRILRDLRVGVAVNDAIARNTAALDTLETEFAGFARDLAGKLGPGLTWEKAEPEDLAMKDGELTAWMRSHPKNYYALSQSARQHVKAKRWQEAKAPLQELIASYPVQTEPGNAYELLAQVHRELKETAEERKVLTRLAAVDSNATDAYLRLMELGEASRDWMVVLENAERFLAVNPLSHATYGFLGRASEALGRADPAIRSYQTLLKLDPPDPAGVHFRLAKLLQAKGDPGARRHVLQALEEAPRFREAHALLLQMPPPASVPEAGRKPSFE